MATLKHHVKFLSPGSFYPEDETREIPERTTEAAMAVAPERAFAFNFYDTAIVDFEFDAEIYKVIPITQNESGRHYIGGTVFTVPELRALAVDEGEPTRYDVLIANVSSWKDGGWVDGRAIRCCTGNWQPYEGEPIVERAAVGA